MSHLKMIALLFVSMGVVFTIIYCNSDYHAVQNSSKVFRRALTSNEIYHEKSVVKDEQNLWEELFSSSKGNNIRGSLASTVSKDEAEERFYDGEPAGDDAAENFLDELEEDDYYYNMRDSYTHSTEVNTEDDEVKHFFPSFTTFFRGCDFALLPYPVENSAKLDPTPFFAWFTFFLDSATYVSDWTNNVENDASFESLDDGYGTESSEDSASNKDDTESS